MMFDKLYSTLIAGGARKTILKGLWATLQISALSLVLGTLLGIGIFALTDVLSAKRKEGGT